MIYDLHTHSSASDGSLEPTALLQYAASCGVDVLAITDHDTLGGFDLLDPSIDRPRLVTGIEFSTAWRGFAVHIVGLNVDLQNRILQDGVARQQQSRQARAQQIAERLEKLGIPRAFDAAQEIAGESPIGRPHFAEYLVSTGFVRDTRAAFRKFLGAGKAGDVKQVWAPLQDIVYWIRTAGGSAVLAHPAKYGMTNTKLRSLAIDFRTAGGVAIEVVCGRQSDSTTVKLAALARDLGMAASCGSDFHNPEYQWSRPGGFPELPPAVMPVWQLW